MDRVSEQLLNAFSEQHGLLAGMPESTRFEHLTCFLAVSLHCNDTFDTSDVVMGKATGIDGIGVIVNGRFIVDVDELDEIDANADLDVTFVFVQADSGSSFDLGKIGTFGYAVVDFFKDAPELPRTPQIKEAAKMMTAVFKRSARFRRGNPVCRMYYATTGTWNNDPTLQARINTIETDLRTMTMFREVNFVPLGAERVQSLYRRITSAIESEFVLDKKVTLPPVRGVTQAYIGYLPFPELLKLISADGQIISSLFYSNPRDWQDWNPVNSEIKTTLESDAKSRFVLMNNGITIIAREIRSTGDNFVIVDYQIVNGCQTSHALFECAKSDDTSIAVPVRLIGTEDESVKNDIIRATNRQTQVTEDQFFAIQEFPKQLEQYFATFAGPKALYYERRSRQYDREAVEKTRIVTQANLIKAFAAMFLGEAHRTTRNYAALKAKVGKDIFGKDHRKEPYYTAAYALYKLEYLFRSGRLDPQFKPARFHILLAVRMIGNREAMPSLSTRRIDQYCQPINELLWDANTSDELLLEAASIVSRAVEGNFDRDSIRTEPTTQRVIDECVRRPQVTASA